jgi:hypothetical protein
MLEQLAGDGGIDDFARSSALGSGLCQSDVNGAGGWNLVVGEGNGLRSRNGLERYRLVVGAAGTEQQDTG